MKLGYAEAMVSAKVWKAGRGLKRPWQRRVERKGMAGASLDAWVRGMAARFPGQIVVQG